MKKENADLKPLTNVTWVAPDGTHCSGLTLSPDEDGHTMVAVQNVPAYGGVPAIWIESDKLTEAPPEKPAPAKGKNGEA